MAELDDSFSGSKMDELLEQRFAYGNPEDDLGDESEGGRLLALEADNEDLNDETFGDVVADREKLGSYNRSLVRIRSLQVTIVVSAGDDFDFSAANARIANEQPNSHGQYGGQINHPREPRAEQIHGNMQQRIPESMHEQMRGSYQEQWESDQGAASSRRPSELSKDPYMNMAHQYNQQQHGYPMQQQPMSLEEIEAQMLQKSRGDGRPVHPHDGRPTRDAHGPPGYEPPDMYGPPNPNRHPLSVAEMEVALRAQRAGNMGPNGGTQGFHQHGAAMVMAVRHIPPPQLGRPTPNQMEMAEAMRRSQSPRIYPEMDRMNDGQNMRGQRPPMQLGHFLPQQRGQVQNLPQGYARMDQNSQRYPNDRRMYMDNRPDIRTREEKYKGTMNQYEKELIAKIQISQLVTDNPYRDDFYYIVYTSLTAANDASSDEPGKAAKPGLNWQQSLLLDQTRGNGPNVTSRMQQQMQRLIEGRKAKPKGNSLSLEGALGKISLSSVRNPRQLLQVNGPGSKDGKENLPTPHNPLLTPKQLLKRIESVYSEVLELEILKRAGPIDDDVESWNTQFEEHREKMWKGLGVAEPVPLHYPHPFAAFLGFGKGKKVIPRVFRFLTRDQSLSLISTLLSRLESLDVCQSTASANQQDVELFMSNVVPTVVSVIMEVPLFVVNACMRILLERHNMVWLAKSKPGLAILTMFLSRAEMVKQGAGGPGFQVAEQELHMWTEIYNFLFASLHNNFASLFPSSANPDVSVNVASDVYVWQFLAALAVGATTVDHQRVLLTEVRDKVLETARRTEDAKALANVNLFLNALGLGIDARQLVNMSGL
ncbi:hypothetical protein PhCBS80983_g02331 [Powellomyces hirtus]|uniref:mRNA decay factor PAT1 domain-containing protein n=1 Tax=Powellomyces hirtus TaxID=109895 RepID=A0A507E6W5_9FUNG|nr:hypothetical protein PhCBS80983_g02331 [Powellomyces hirtus]